MRKLVGPAIVLMSACGVGPGTREDVEATPPAAGASSAPSPGAPDAPAGAVEGEQGIDTPYDRAVQKSVHNAYAKEEPLFDQLVWHRARSLELDVHVSRSGEGDVPGDWFVYHEDVPFMRDTSCFRLSDCLGQIAAFHAAVPKHEVVTLLVDLKDAFSNGHTQADLDALFVEHLGRDAIVAPKDLLDRCPGAASLREAVAGTCAFPTLGDLRGKIVIATTGGTACDASSNVSAYAGADPAARIAFAAPNTDRSCPMTAYDAKPGFVVFNMSFDERARAADVKARGLVARIYKGGLDGGLDSAQDFEGARAAGAQHLATDRVNVEGDPWATTSSTTGFPFACEGCAPPRSEAGSFVAMRALSGDMWDAADSMYFAGKDDAGDAAWSAFVAVPSSRVEPWAKACLVARARDAPGAANVAVCRPFDRHPPRMQVRATDGGATHATEMASFAGLADDGAAFLRLSLKGAGAGTDAIAEASVDGKAWREIGRTTIASPLPLRGVAVASHGGAPVRAVFGNVRRTAAGVSETMTAEDLATREAIGAGAGGSAGDGLVP